MNHISVQDPVDVSGEAVSGTVPSSSEGDHPSSLCINIIISGVLDFDPIA